MGLRQGCNLSPTLFCLFINDLFEYLKSKHIRGIQLTPDDLEIFMLLFADDVALASDTIFGLQQQLHYLHEFCIEYKLEVNVQKTKIVVFKNGGRLSSRENWYYADEKLECINGFTYVGVYFSSTLSMYKMSENMAVKAKRVIVSLISSLYEYMPMQYNCYFKLIDAKVMPILFYGSELWGLKSFDAVERVHIYACKRFMSAPLHTCNMAVLGDCGRYPVYIFTCKRVIKFWLRMLKMTNTRNVKKCYEMLKVYDGLGYKNWVTSLREHLFSVGFGYVWNEQGVVNENIFLFHYFQRLKDVFKQSWSQSCNDTSKLITYTGFKIDFEWEKYLNVLLIRKFRNAYVRFRTSSHQLMIEHGRYINLERNERLCPLCKTTIENEYHFLLVCSFYEDLREMYIPSRFYDQPTINKFNNAMTSRDENIIRNIAMYIYYAFERRKMLLT